MTLDDLRVFVSVCRAGSLSAVARELGCTQSAVSQHVKRLEREAGVSLLERRPRGVVPTHAGRVLWDAAADSIAGLDAALRRVGDLVNGDSGAVRVTTGGTTVRHFMAEAVVAFRQRYPKVSLEFQTETSSRRCFEALADGHLDLAWVTMDGPVRGIEQRPVVDLPWVLAVRADDPLAGRSRVDAADLADVRLIRLPHNSTSGARLDAAFADAGIRSRSDTGVADWDTALLLAELGLGHAVVPALPGRPVPGDGPLRLVPVPDLPPLAVGWAVRRWDALSPLARSFAETVAGSCRQRDVDRAGHEQGDGAAPRASRPPAARRSGPPATAKSIDGRGRRGHDPSS
ncbi:LysR family transcriptional regulator [Streptomyces sp. A244]|uniref:LysR family transcriptional regulator n=1 Tax=Streptomyces sp. A244 TaxID=2137016 RepID=UPI000D1C0466|nr:LysR family transcriptional regulator [Streptomyces sp. A244]PTH86472.1 LysR family transcriptional regulator [Streptomyces sp. A244]